MDPLKKTSLNMLTFNPFDEYVTEQKKRQASLLEKTTRLEKTTQAYHEAVPLGINAISTKFDGFLGFDSPSIKVDAINEHNYDSEILHEQLGFTPKQIEDLANDSKSLFHQTIHRRTTAIHKLISSGFAQSKIKEYAKIPSSTRGQFASYIEDMAFSKKEVDSKESESYQSATIYSPTPLKEEDLLQEVFGDKIPKASNLRESLSDIGLYDRKKRLICCKELVQATLFVTKHEIFPMQLSQDSFCRDINGKCYLLKLDDASRSKQMRDGVISRLGQILIEILTSQQELEDGAYLDTLEYGSLDIYKEEAALADLLKRMLNKKITLEECIEKLSEIIRGNNA